MIDSTVARLLRRILIELGTLVVQGIIIFAIALIAMCIAFPLLDWGIGSQLTDYPYR